MLQGVLGNNRGAKFRALLGKMRTDYPAGLRAIHNYWGWSQDPETGETIVPPTITGEEDGGQIEVKPEPGEPDTEEPGTDEETQTKTRSTKKTTSSSKE